MEKFYFHLFLKNYLINFKIYIHLNISVLLFSEIEFSGSPVLYNANTSYFVTKKKEKTINRCY